MKCAVVTMVYNEETYLPIWRRYYGAIFGPENCHIVDHGSDDGSTEGLTDFNIIKLPRSPMDDERRARFLSGFCSNLLERYGAVIYVDVDEIIVADPGRYASLLDYIAIRPGPVISAYGFDIFQDLKTENPLDLTRSILGQRQWMRFSSPMCKPLLAYQPLNWSPGFHSANYKIQFDQIYLFHLRYFDLTLGLRRLRKTRSMPWANPSAGSHQKFSDEEFERLMRTCGRLPKMSGISLLPHEEPLKYYVQRVKQTEVDFKTNVYSIDLSIYGHTMFQIPSRFRKSF
jgi:hypothetical protein